MDKTKVDQNRLLESNFVVVGAGPIGSAAAISLAQLSDQLNVILIDQTPGNDFDLSQLDTRVFAINSGSESLLENLGAWQQILNTRAQAYQRMHVWDAEGTGAIDFSAEELGADQLGHIIEVGVIQNALNQRLQSMQNIQVIRPAKVLNVDFNPDSVALKLDNGTSVRSDLLIAADGARSSMRDLAGIDTSQEDCYQQALVANVQLSRPHESCAWQIFRSTGPLAFLPLSSEDESKQLCSIVWTLDNDKMESIKDLPEDKFERVLTQAVENRFGQIRLTSPRHSFPLVQRHAEKYSDKAMVLLGDAAHSIHPLAGLGANLGFQDVAALTSEMHRAYERQIAFSHSSVLSRYQRKRRLDNELTLKLMSLFRRGFADHGLAMNALRNIGLKAFSKIKPIKAMMARQALMSEAVSVKG